MDTTDSLSRDIAQSLLQIKAVALRPQDPFTWTSGIKSPIYCDNRLTMSHPEIRKKIADGFVSIIKEHYPQVEVIAGTATAGIAHAAWVADLMNLPMIYVRDKAKGHGKQNQIEGELKPGQKVVVIEDLISTGGSSVKAALAVNEAGGNALAVAAIFTYQLDQAVQNFAEKDISLHTLSNYETLIETALEKGEIKQDDVALLKSWRDNPEQFGI
jgi:orotate phosphoribosyltransferase